jgi:OTU domain-containing protein 6
MTSQAMSGTPSGASTPSQFKLLRSIGDGSCLFRSLAQGDHLAKGSKEPMSAAEETRSARALRLAVIKEMAARKEEIEPFIPGILDGDLTFEAYLARMQLPFTWGGEPEIVMAMNLIQRPIHVWRIVESQVEPIVSYGVEEFGASPSVNLLWHKAGHYDCLAIEDKTK